MEKRGQEIEAKFRLEPGQRAQLEGLLGSWEHERLEQEDRYFDVPGRVLRLRREGEAWVVTRKDAPAIAPDGTKQRLEIETPVPAELVGALAELFTWLGHAPLLTVHKVRDAYHQAGVTACLDRIEGVADDYLELEVLATEDAGALEPLRARLGLAPEQIELRSYARILAEVSRKTPPSPP